jgi:7,8-dihydroneopterin aldolase/epimerase/oxygenase
MLTISLQNIRLHGPHGLYAEEAELGNDFEIDVDLRLPATITEDWPLIDYTRINDIVRLVMRGERVPLLEMLVRDIWKRLRAEWPQLSHIRVAIRKLRPPMKGDIRAAQVCFEGS